MIKFEYESVNQLNKIYIQIELMQQVERENELEYNRFCSYGNHDMLGVCIEGEYLYIVQSQKISVYEYHGNYDKPQLSEELIHNKLIKDYAINKYYISIYSVDMVEVRDRKHWGNVVYTYLINENEGERFIILDNHTLYLSKKENGSLIFQKIDVSTKQIISYINLGKVNDPSFDILNKIKPIFLNQLGMLNDFYIWAKSRKEVELGMLYTNQGASKKKFEINQIQISDGVIHQIYHHKVNCLKYPNQSPQYVAIVVEKQIDKQIYLHLYEILPRDHKKQHVEVTEFQGKFQGILNQFSFLRNLNEPTHTNSLVQEVFNEAIPSEAHPKSQQRPHFQIKLQNLYDYKSSYFKEGKLWIVSSLKLCKIELALEESIQNIIKSYKNEQKMVKSILYEDKPASKKFIGIYNEKSLFSQATTSFDLAFIRDNEEIAQEIQEYEINDQILEKEGRVKISEQAEKLRNDYLLLTLGEKEQENNEEEINKEEQSYNILVQSFSQTQLPTPILQQFQHSQTDPPPKPLQNESFSQTRPLKIQVCQFSTQTATIEQKPLYLGLQEIQDLVAKYSSSVSVSCTKVKQNSYIKDKFDRQIFNIVENIVKESVQPFIQSKFVLYLQNKIKDITQHISTVFQTQLESLNEFMRKNETKQNNLRGRRIFQFSNQINNLKETVSVITQAIKGNEIHRRAFNQVILSQAKEMKQQMAKISISIVSLQDSNKAAQKGINSQVTQIFELLKVLDEKHKENAQDSSCQAESEEENQQREVDETSEQQNISEDSNQEIQREQMHYRYPPYHHHPRVQEHKKNIKSFQPLDKGYNPYPSDFYHAPPQMPYYYPFMPPIPSMPMQGYYPHNYPSYPMPKTEQPYKTQPKNIKTPKKVKKNS